MILTIRNDFEGTVESKYLPSADSLRGWGSKEIQNHLTMNRDKLLWYFIISFITLKTTESPEKTRACQHGGEKESREGSGSF